MNETAKMFGQTVQVFRAVDDQEIVEEVRVRVVKVKDQDAYLSSVGKEERLIQLATGKDPEWIGTLLPESFETLASATHTINTLPLLAARDRRMDRLEQVNPGTKERSRQLLEKFQEQALDKLSHELHSKSGAASLSSENGPIPISVLSSPPSPPAEAPANSTTTSAP